MGKLAMNQFPNKNFYSGVDLEFPNEMPSILMA